MRRGGLVLLISLALAGCAKNQLDTPLAELDLADPSVIRELQSGLGERERAALATYALLHWPGSKAYCGQPLFRGPQPRTVSEAIEKTIGFQLALERKRAEETRPASSIEQRARRLRGLVVQFDEMEHQIAKTESSTLPKDEKRSQIATLRAAMDDNRRERAALEGAALALAP